ncbi:MAG TPA: hypothetical protein VMQ76_13080 [Terracidiphilus sp.]|nr:hypothetical protein [Terracidiphilus sp.]
MKTLLMWLAALLALAGGVWLCRGQPVPPKPKTVTESPKGKEARLALVKVAAPAAPKEVVIPGKALVWTCTNPVCVVVSSTLLSPGFTAWKIEGYTTNHNTWPIIATNAACFYKVGAVP